MVATAIVKYIAHSSRYYELRAGRVVGRNWIGQVSRRIAGRRRRHRSAGWKVADRGPGLVLEFRAVPPSHDIASLCVQWSAWFCARQVGLKRGRSAGRNYVDGPIELWHRISASLLLSERGRKRRSDQGPCPSRAVDYRRRGAAR